MKKHIADFRRFSMNENDNPFGTAFGDDSIYNEINATGFEGSYAFGIFEEGDSLPVEIYAYGSDAMEMFDDMLANWYGSGGGGPSPNDFSGVLLRGIDLRTLVHDYKLPVSAFARLAEGEALERGEDY
jgi:hypothetical protein